MKRIHLLLGVSTLGLLALCGCGGSGKSATGKNLRAYYPTFQLGDQWRWRVRTTGATEQTELQTVAATEDHEGVTGYRIERAPTGGSRTEAEVLGLTGERLLQFGFDTYDATGALSDSVRYPAPWGIKVNLEPGETTTHTFQLTDESDGTPVVSTFQIDLRYAGVEPVTVTAGTFQAARMEITTTIMVRVGTETQPAEVSHHTEWRAEGIGPVKSTDDDGTTEELLGAKVGGVSF